jgi:SpoVK/Ycf46/Vps4 family AAA+-type ATPase
MDVDLAAIAAVSDTFTGAELAALVPDAMFAAFNDGGREITTDDLLIAAKTVVPLARQQAEKIEKLRSFWLERARPASIAVVGGVREPERAARQLDI